LGASCYSKMLDMCLIFRLYLISTGTLDEEGYHNYFGDGKWKLSKNSLIVAKGKKMGLYMSQVKVIKG